MLNLLLTLICNFETTFCALKAKKLDRFNTEEGFLELEEDIVLNTSANDKDDLVMIVMGKDKEIVNDDNHPIKEKDIDHPILLA